MHNGFKVQPLLRKEHGCSDSVAFPECSRLGCLLLLFAGGQEGLCMSRVEGPAALSRLHGLVHAEGPHVLFIL